MPTYVYECGKCGDELEVWQSFSDDPLKKHPSCGGKLTKVYQPVGIVLKGPGFYKTDSRNGKKSSTAAESGSSDSGSNGKESSGKESNARESKSESKSDTKDTKKPEPKKADKATAASSKSS